MTDNSIAADVINGGAALFGTHTDQVKPIADFVINRLADMNTFLPEDLSDPVTWVSRELAVSH